MLRGRRMGSTLLALAFAAMCFLAGGLLRVHVLASGGWGLARDRSGWLARRAASPLGCVLGARRARRLDGPLGDLGAGGTCAPRRAPRRAVRRGAAGRRAGRLAGAPAADLGRQRPHGRRRDRRRRAGVGAGHARTRLGAACLAGELRERSWPRRGDRRPAVVPPSPARRAGGSRRLRGRARPDLLAHRDPRLPRGCGRARRPAPADPAPGCDHRRRGTRRAGGRSRPAARRPFRGTGAR